MIPDDPSAYPGWELPPDGVTGAIPATPSGWLVRGTARLLGRTADRADNTSVGDEPKLGRALLEFAPLAFSRGPMPMEARAAMTVGLAVLWGAVIAVIMTLFVLLAWMTNSAPWVVAGFPIVFGLAFGEMMMWLVRWSVAVQRQKRTSAEMLGEFPTWAATEWIALVAGVAGVELVIFLGNA